MACDPLRPSALDSALKQTLIQAVIMPSRPVKLPHAQMRKTELL